MHILLLSLLLLQPVIFGQEPFIDEQQLIEEMLQESITTCPPTDFKNPCSNTDDCNVYGDCCSKTTLKHLQNSTGILDPVPPTLNPWKCRSFKMQWGGKFIFMVSSCPAQWKDPEVSQRCTKSVHLNSYTHFLDVPVLSEDTNVIYANIYCAVCNNDSSAIAPNQLTIWCNPATPQCYSLIQNAQYTPGQLYWKTGRVYIVAYINDFPSSRQCIPYIDYCASKNSSLETTEETAYRKLCYMHSYPIRVYNKILPGSIGVYKNVHCAVCNGILPNVSSCTHKDKDIDPPIVTQTFTFSLLIDFNGGGNVGVASACGVGRMYDAVKRTCVAYFCGKMYEMNKFGKCTPKKLSQYTSTIHADYIVNTEVGLNESCAKILVTQHEYNYLNSSTIRVNRTNHENIFETQYFEETGNGSILICAPDTVTSYTDKFSATQGLLSSICLAFSLACLAVHILVYLSVAKFRNLPGKNLLSLSCSIFVAQLLFISAVNLKEPHSACVAIGATIHLSYLASFFWMNVMAYDMFRTFASKSFRQNDQHQQRRKFKLYSTYAWMCPCLIVAISLILDATNAIPELKPQYAEPYCWINSKMALGIFFVLPLLVLLVENIVFFTLTTCAIRRTNADAAMVTRASSASEKTRFLLYLKLASIVGLTWIFGFIAAWTDLETFWYLNIILNSLQGAFIFFAFTFKRTTLSEVKKKLPKNYFTPQEQKAAEPVTTTRFQLTELPRQSKF